MDLHRTSSAAPFCDAERPLAGAADPHPGSDAWIAARLRERQALDALEAEITELWGHINAATARFLTLLAEFDRREGWAQHGVSNCAHWLNWQCGISRAAAREKVRTARALESLPKIAAAFGEGRLSYSKVRAVTRVATAETEDLLLNIALHGTAAHVERTVRGFRRVQRYRERSEAEAIQERRYLNCRRDADGTVRLEARLTPEVGELLLKALQAAEADIEEQRGDAEPAGNVRNARSTDKAGEAGPACKANGDVSAETSPAQFVLPPRPDAAPGGVSQRRADALEHILDRFLAGKCSGSAAGAHEVVVHIAHDALCDVPESGGASFEHGGTVAVETARRLGCDGALIGVVEGDKGEPLAVGRRTRAVPPAIRRALRIRDGGCRFPGCDRSRFTHAHHIRHWADGGETNLNNLVTLCSQHHRLVHEGGYGVRVEEGEIQFMRPDGRIMPAAGMPHGGRFRGNASATCRPLSGGPEPAGGAQRLAAVNAARGLAIDARTARCGWGGERMDYDIAIDALCLQAGYS